MKEWVGQVYPPKTKAADYLKYYSKQFNTIELNTTHYRIPDRKLIEKWIAQSTPDFKFCPKLPQVISHRADFWKGIRRFDSIFVKSFKNWRINWVCCFMQLPPYFGYDRLDQLEAFLKIFPTHIPLAIELRHESWFDQDDRKAAAFDLLQKISNRSGYYGCSRKKRCFAISGLPAE